MAGLQHAGDPAGFSMEVNRIAVPRLQLAAKDESRRSHRILVSVNDRQSIIMCAVDWMTNHFKYRRFADHHTTESKWKADALHSDSGWSTESGR